MSNLSLTIKERTTMHRNKNVMRTDRNRTTLSVSPTSIDLYMGLDMDEKKMHPFLTVLDELVTGIESKAYYGHFEFSRDKVEITLSMNEKEPDYFDITYAYEI